MNTHDSLIRKISQEQEQELIHFPHIFRTFSFKTIKWLLYSCMNVSGTAKKSPNLTKFEKIRRIWIFERITKSSILFLR